MEVAHVDFVAVPTQDIARAKQFYGETLGLELEVDRPTGAEFRAGQVTLGIYSPEAVGFPFAPNPAGFALRVDDVEAARAELESKGVAFAADTFDTGVCHMALFHDPDGNALLLHRRYAP
jgi:predicted enzyme related to lactoylglutathione lyase